MHREAKRPLEEHISDFENKLEAAGRTDQYVKETLKYVREIAQHAGFELVTDICAEAVNRFTSQLRDKGKSHRTIAAYLSAIKSFSRWLANGHKLARDPLASIEKPNPQTDRRHARRMLLRTEWQWIDSVLSEGVDRYGMPSTERCLLYRTAIETGLRANELRSLNRACLFLDAEQPYVTVGAESTKKGEACPAIHIRPAGKSSKRARVHKSPFSQSFLPAPRIESGAHAEKRSGRRPQSLAAILLGCHRTNQTRAERLLNRT
jgi:site-specific recombinase XerC